MLGYNIITGILNLQGCKLEVVSFFLTSTLTFFLHDTFIFGSFSDFFFSIIFEEVSFLFSKSSTSSIKLFC